MRSDSSTAARRARVDQISFDDAGATLVEITAARWEQFDEKAAYLQDLDKAFHEYLNDLILSSNACATGYDKFNSRHVRWRRTIIISTGVVAGLNLLAAYRWQAPWEDLSKVLALVSAAAAISVTVLANLESFGNPLEQAQALREAREMFLDASREFERLWNTQVIPFGESPEACVNATELYRRVVIADRELRSKLKDLTKIQTKQQKS